MTLGELQNWISRIIQEYPETVDQEVQVSLTPDGVMPDGTSAYRHMEDLYPFPSHEGVIENLVIFPDFVDWVEGS